MVKVQFFGSFSIFMVALILCANAAWAMGERPEDNKPPSDYAKELDRIRELKKGGKCPDQTIIVEIDGIQLRISRTMDVRFKDGTEIIGLRELQYRCDLEVLNDVLFVWSNEIVITSMEDGVDNSQFYKDKIGESKETAVQLESSLISYSDGLFYTVPTELVPRKSGLPIIIFCETSEQQKLSKPYQRCNITDYHPVGIQFKTHFLRKNLQESEYLEHTLKKLEEYEGLIVHQSSEGEE